MKKSLIYTLSSVAIMSATAIAFGASISTISKNVNSNIENDYSSLEEGNNQIQENIDAISNQENIDAISNKVNELNNISFVDFQVNINQLDTIKNLTQEDIWKNLITKSYIERNKQFNYKIVDFKNNLTNKTISFKIRVLNFNNENEYLDTNSYSISWSLNTDENIQEINLDKLLEMSNSSIFMLGETYNIDYFKELVYKELSKERNFDVNAKTNYYHTQKGRFITEPETRWEDKKYMIAIDTQSGISFDVKEETNKYLFRGQIIYINKYYVNSITISGQNMLDTWLTKSVQKSISQIYCFACPELTKAYLEAEKINIHLDQREILQDTVISQEIFNSQDLITDQNGLLVNYSPYYISGSKGIENNLLNPIVQKMLVDSLNYNNNLGFDYENFEYNLTSGTFIKIQINGGLVSQVVVRAQIQVKSKLDGTIINTQQLQFNILVQYIDLFDNPNSILERMGINMVNDGTYGQDYWVDDDRLCHYVEISKETDENKWFYEYWRNQQVEYVKNKFNVEDPKIEPIKVVKTWSFGRQLVEILMDKSKDTFYDTFRAIYGVDYEESIKKLANEGKGSEAALLQNMHKIKVYGWIDDIRYDHGFGFCMVYRTFRATALQIFLDDNETIGFGAKDIEDQEYQRAVRYIWRYKKYNKSI